MRSSAPQVRSSGSSAPSAACSIRPCRWATSWSSPARRASPRSRSRRARSSTRSRPAAGANAPQSPRPMVRSMRCIRAKGSWPTLPVSRSGSSSGPTRSSQASRPGSPHTWARSCSCRPSSAGPSRPSRVRGRSSPRWWPSGATMDRWPGPRGSTARSWPTSRATFRATPTTSSPPSWQMAASSPCLEAADTCSPSACSTEPARASWPSRTAAVGSSAASPAQRVWATSPATTASSTPSPPAT